MSMMPHPNSTGISSLLKVSWKFPGEYAPKEAIKIYAGRLLVFICVIILNGVLLGTFLLALKAPIISAVALVTALAVIVIIFLYSRRALKEVWELRDQLQKQQVILEKGQSELLERCAKLQEQYDMKSKDYNKLLSDYENQRQRHDDLKKEHDGIMDQFIELLYNNNLLSEEEYPMSRSAVANSNEADSQSTPSNLEEDPSINRTAPNREKVPDYEERMQGKL